MNKLPTPWHHNEAGLGGISQAQAFNDDTGLTIVMFDPMSPMMPDLLELMEHDEASISDMLRNYITFDNDSLNRAGPQGLQIVTADWSR